jgi:hypothetical protein
VDKNPKMYIPTKNSKETKEKFGNVPFLSFPDLDNLLYGPDGYPSEKV